MCRNQVNCAKSHTALSELQEERAYRKHENHWVTVYHILSLDEDNCGIVRFCERETKKSTKPVIVLYTCKNDRTQLTINIFTTWKNDVNADETDFAYKHAKEVKILQPPQKKTHQQHNLKTQKQKQKPQTVHVLI